MSRRPRPELRHRTSAEMSAAAARRLRKAVALGKRARGIDTSAVGPSLPPEDWHEPSETAAGSYRVIVQTPGAGYRHAVTAGQVRARLSELPRHLVEPLEVVQLSRMTRKKKTFPCYGLQWGNAIYLYPIENDLVEYYVRPPRPGRIIEARMYGGRWEQVSSAMWRLVWTERAIQDYYLNNILIHELGHVLDSRNSSYADRERFAEWFAIEHGYRRSRRTELARRAASKLGRRRHHSCGF